MMSIFRKLFPLVVLLLLSSSLFAQTYRASLRGTINDQRGAVITGAQIRLTNNATGITRTTVSGSDGEYTISSLSPAPSKWKCWLIRNKGVTLLSALPVRI